VAGVLFSDTCMRYTPEIGQQVCPFPRIN